MFGLRVGVTFKYIYGGGDGMHSNRQMVLPESLLVVIVSTLSGGLEREGLLVVNGTNRSSNSNQSLHANYQHLIGNGSCGIGTRWPECHVLDEHIKPFHLAVPWCITLGAIVILSMPTVLLRSRQKEKGLRLVAGNILQFMGLLTCASFITDHPSICFALTLHSCVRLLVQLELSDALVGGAGWWTLRYAVVWILLCLQLCLGPSISVVRWPSTPAGSALSCAYLAHLVGCILPDITLVSLRWLIAVLNCVKMRDD